MFFRLGTSDAKEWSSGTIYESTGKLHIAVTGTDVILGDNNLPVTVSVNEDALLAGGQVVDFLSGAQHTYSTGRTDAGGWQGIEFGDKEPTPGTVEFDKTVDGQYGRLTWSGVAGKYVYTAYDPADASLTEAQRAAGVAVRGLVDGPTLTETFTYTVYDKNGESDSGRTVITIDGKSDGFSVTLPDGASVAVTEGGVLDVQLSAFISTQDAGTIRYYIRYTDPDTGNTVDTYLNASGGAVELVETTYGRLLFSPGTGNYAFVPNGILQEGEQKSLDIKVRAVLTTEGVEQDTDWRAYGIEITGVNDAPVMQPDSIFLAFLGNDAPGALAWTDIDNNPSEQAGMFRLDARSEASGDAGSTADGLETVHGMYGDLTLNVNQGAFTYDLKEDVFTGDTHRVVDEFQVKVTDPGSDGQGAHALESGEESLFIYGVDGGFLQGADAMDTITLPDAGKAYIIHGGAGDDTIDLTGSTGQNVLVWKSGDEGSEASPAMDTILNFNAGPAGDALYLRGLLDGLKAADVGGSAKDLISFEVADGNTTINIGAVDDPGGQVVQQIVLSNVELDTSNGAGYDQLAHQILLITS
jgi:VCBS repeat-containing protein